MDGLTRYNNFKELKKVEAPMAPSTQSPLLSQFEVLLARLRSEFVAQTKAKNTDGK
jgi:hypothetical protein